jgi:very-short-patch-repair endonuclease
LPVYNPGLKKFSQELRKNMTDAERLVWSRIRRKQLKGLQVYRQRIIGNYIVDFYCPKAKLVVELDGGQHFTEEGLKKDAVRDVWINNQGFTVLRFSDEEVLSNLDGVLEKIYENM